VELEDEELEDPLEADNALAEKLEIELELDLSESNGKALIPHFLANVSFALS
jgi:hypothetical protein